MAPIGTSRKLGAGVNLPPPNTEMQCRFHRVLAVVALVLSLASPWALLQSVAWVGMLVKFSRGAGLAQAVSMTFDGQHPCSLCKTIEAGKAKERQQPRQSQRAGKEVNLFLPPPSVALIPPRVPGVPTDAFLIPSARREPPPTPPPRHA